MKKGGEMKSTRYRAGFTVILSALSLNTYASCICFEPSEPSIPSGYYAEPYQMESAKNDVESYVDGVQSYKQCLAQCIDDANSNAENVIDEWNSAVRQYNNR